MKKVFLTMMLIFSSFGAFATVEPVELSCKAKSGDYSVRVVRDCPYCFGPQENREVGSMTLAPYLERAFVRKVTERFETVLGQGEFLVEQIDGKWVFANLRDNFLMTCEDQKEVREVLTGFLERMFAVGGETSGIGLRSNGQLKLVELRGATAEISQELRSMFGARVGVVGRFKTMRGVSRGPYKVFVVEKVMEALIQPQPPIVRPFPPADIEPWL